MSGSAIKLPQDFRENIVYVFLNMYKDTRESTTPASYLD